MLLLTSREQIHRSNPSRLALERNILSPFTTVLKGLVLPILAGFNRFTGAVLIEREGTAILVKFRSENSQFVEKTVR